MQFAFETLFNLIKSNLISPLSNAILNTSFLIHLSQFITNFINCFFRLFNNDNSLVIIDVSEIKYIIGELFGLFSLVLLIYFCYLIFKLLINAFRGFVK